MGIESRIKIAMEFLKERQPFTIRDLRLGVEGYDLLTVTGWSKHLNFSSLTKERSLNELTEIKDNFSDMVTLSKELQGFIADKSIEYILCYDDGGKATIEVCAERGGVIKWKIELP